MKKILLSLWVSLLCVPAFSQLLSWSPAFQTESSATAFQINMSPGLGNRALYFYTPTSDVYVHIGVITNLSTNSADWKYVQPANFNLPVPALQTTFIPNSPSPTDDIWRFTINGGLRTYFNITNPAEHIQKIAILFRNGNGSKVQRNADGSDMYIPINDGTLDVKFTTPFFQPLYSPVPENINLTVGASINLAAVASASSNMRLLFDGNPIATQTGVTTISTTQNSLTSGSHNVTAEAVSGITKTSSFNFFVPAPNTVQALPTGVKQGINYEADQTAATLVLYAPGKTRVSVIGDLPGSNWGEQLSYQMKQTPDNNYYWLRITGLTPGTEYSFQYLVDGNIRIGEAYTEKVLDPWNDPYINTPVVTYPGLKAYPTGLTSGVVSILQTAAPAYNWQTTTYTRPDKRNLMVYELLLRDFIARHDWTGMTDTLNYLKKLGINTIELMPVNEFEGNNSWGYNPDYYLAPDKYYGPKNDLKRFVDMAHSRGIAVVMDIALNHSFGLSPMVQLYWDAANNRPAANNPWFNAVPKHAFNVGYDMNHSTAATNYFFSRVVEHWLTEYKMDGFRFDLSKGFTQNQTCDGSGGNCDVNAWSTYDASRITIWKKYYDTLQLKSPGSYAILEHFADNNEEIQLSDYGMLLWGNVHSVFKQAALSYGFPGRPQNEDGSDFNNALHITRGWNNPYLVSYMESHDEERQMFDILQYARLDNPSYNPRTLPNATQRVALNAAFLFTMPGPKMIWQFGELGYEYSINYCQDGSINNNCRVDPKPIRWDYLENTDRKKLHDAFANILNLRSNPLFFQTFTTGNISRSLDGRFRWMTINSPVGKLVVVGNFDVFQQTGAVTFPAAGTWYDYLNPPATFNATGASQSITLQPGEYRIYLNSFVVLPVSITNFNGRNDGNNNLLTWVVENEVNVSRYELQRSENGSVFYAISSTNANGSRNYHYTDAEIKKPVYFYRLKIIDVDGTYSYSTVIKLNGPVKTIGLAATPNPFGNVMKLTIASPAKESATLVLTDLSGKTLLQKNVNLLQGVNTIEIEKLQSLAAGTYILNLVSAQNKTSIRVIKTLE